MIWMLASDLKEFPLQKRRILHIMAMDMGDRAVNDARKCRWTWGLMSPACKHQHPGHRARLSGPGSHQSGESLHLHWTAARNPGQLDVGVRIVLSLLKTLELAFTRGETPDVLG